MNKTQRKENLMPNNQPKWIRCYDLGKDQFDRYTVVYTKISILPKSEGSCFMYVGMSNNPFSPTGFGQHGESMYKPIDRPTYGHLGKKIKFTDLPEDCQKLVISDYVQLWDIEHPYNVKEEN